MLLCGDDKFDWCSNMSITSSAIKFIISTERFSNSTQTFFKK